MLIDFNVQNEVFFSYWKPLMHKATDRLVKELERTELQNIQLRWSTVEDGSLLILHLQGFSPTLGDSVHVSKEVTFLKYEGATGLEVFTNIFVTSVLHVLNQNKGVLHDE